MRSARRHALIEKKKKTVKFTGLFLKFILPAIFILVVLAIFKFSTKYWNGTDKFAFTFLLDSGDVAVNVLDPKLNELTTLVIPGDTQVEVARNYGELRIKNVWQLGINEKIEGRLLAETVTQGFLFPVFLWSSKDANALVAGNTFGILRFIFFPESTNISFWDRVSVGLFAMRVGDSGKSSLDLGKNQFLVKRKLNDGLMGYILGGTISQRLTVYFADNSFADKNVRVAIEDATGTSDVAGKVGQIIEVLGGKVVAIDKKTAIDTDCKVFGTAEDAVKKVAEIFSCKVVKNAGDFDLEIDLGSAFAKRF